MSVIRSRQILVLILAGCILCACNMPGVAKPTVSAAGLIYTAAAATLQARSSEVARPSTGSSTPMPVSPTVGPAFPSPAVTQAEKTVLPPTPGGSTTPQPVSLPPAPSSCDRANFIADITVPDGTDIAPGASFVKTWRLKNAGTCTWTPEYRAVFAGGSPLGAPATLPLITRPVAPGETVDVSISFQAPVAPGSYRNEWLLSNAAGAPFGLGDGTKTFWVQVNVGVVSGLLYDFLVRAPEARWSNGVGSSPGLGLAFGGSESDPNGAAAIKDGARLENGAVSGKILLTVPRREASGYVGGTFPAYTIQAGDRLRGRVGFMTGPNGCTGWQVRFRVGYQAGDTVQPLQDFEKACDGRLLPIDLDLSSLAGKTVQLVFTVVNESPSGDNWAIWNSPRIEH